MNAVVCLCHFCELHGPSVLMCTLPCRDSNVQSPAPKNFYGPPQSLTAFSTSPFCEACHSLGDRIFVSSDHESQTSYVSSRFPWQSETEGLVRQACTRSLSCEVSPGKEGLLIFSDDLGSGSTANTSVLSQTFLIQDSLARGFHRWFSIIVLTRDRLLLLNMWPFLETNIAAFVSELQTAAGKVYETEQVTTPQRALRLNNAHCADRTSRTLAELTGTPHIFAQVHLWFTWLLRGAAVRLRETLTPIDISLPMEPVEEVEDGYTIITAKEKNKIIKPGYVDGLSTAFQMDTRGPSIEGLFHLRSVLGSEDFLRMVYCLLVGRQIIVRGYPPTLVASILLTMKTLIPRSCIRLVPMSEQYLPPSQCNLLGLGPQVAVPQPSSLVARLEILQSSIGELSDKHPQFFDASQFRYHLKWTGQLPTKWPSILTKLDRAMESNLLTETTLKLQVTALRLETWNSAAVLKQLESQDKRNSGETKDKTALLQALGVSPCDVEVLMFWSKSHVKSD